MSTKAKRIARKVRSLPHQTKTQHININSVVKATCWVNHVMYYELVDGRVAEAPAPTGLVWTGAKFETKKILAGRVQ